MTLQAQDTKDYQPPPELEETRKDSLWISEGSWPYGHFDFGFPAFGTGKQCSSVVLSPNLWSSLQPWQTHTGPALHQTIVQELGLQCRRKLHDSVLQTLRVPVPPSSLRASSSYLAQPLSPLSEGRMGSSFSALGFRNQLAS